MKRSRWIPLVIVAALLAVFYLAVSIMPALARSLMSRSIYNYRETAQKALARQDYETAVAVLERAAREVPKDIYFERPEYIYEWVGQIRRQQGNPAESLTVWLRAQRLYFRNINLRGYFPKPSLIKDIVEAYFAAGNYAAAYHETRAALDFYPMLADELLQLHGRHADRDPRIARNLGLLELKVSQMAIGREHLRASLQRDPTLPDTNFWLGRLAEQDRQPEAAAAAYEAELANNPYADDAAMQLLGLYNKLGRDPAPLRDRLEKTRALAIAHFTATNPDRPLAAFWGINASLERKFELETPGQIVINIAADSTPCDGVYGLVELTLDGRHVLNLYLDQPPLWPGGRLHQVWLDYLEAGSHVLRIENLTDLQTKTADRNAFIRSVRVYPLGSRPS